MNSRRRHSSLRWPSVSTSSHQLEVSGVTVEVVRKDIKNLHLAAYPPDGHVRIAVPLHVDDEAVRLAVASRLGWIRKQQAGYRSQERQSEREMVTGESHFVGGRRYRLDVVEGPRSAVRIRNSRTLELHVRPGATASERGTILDRWYRRQLKERIPDLIAKWEPKVGARVNEWGVKKMKTRWGTCNKEAGRIWLNLELAKKPPICLEYIVVHEMVHLLERHHNDRFRDFMDALMPKWRLHRHELNRTPLKHEDWTY
jgi:predicted metal-dependent hydrolase